MTWSTSDITDDVIYIDGTGAMNFIPGETIKAGQVVYISDSNTVKVTTSSSNECDGIGIASINATSDDKRIGVYVKGNNVRCCFDSDYSPGTLVYATDDGLLTSIKGNSSKIVGIVTETPSLSIGATNYVGNIMLY